MICRYCREQKHTECVNKEKETYTHCDCQHKQIVVKDDEEIQLVDNDN